MKNVRKIKVPNVLIDDRNISPKVTLLYIKIREIASYDTGIVEVSKKKLMERLNWSDNRTLKKYCEILKNKELIKYDFDVFPKFNPLKFNLPEQKSKFEFISIDVLYKLLEITSVEAETLIRIYLLYKQYTHKEYKYCWLSYSDIIQKVPVSCSTITKINKILNKLQVVKVEKGVSSFDSDNKFAKERNKYHVL